MEDNGILDPSDIVHMYALHYIYIMRINSSLASFTEVWNGHPLRTANNSSPFQLWICGMLRHGHEMSPLLQGSIDLSNSNTTSPPVPIEQELQRHVNPSDYSDTWGSDLYIVHCSFYLIQTCQDHNTYSTLCTIVILTTCVSPMTWILH